jgi:hypothetical protein
MFDQVLFFVKKGFLHSLALAFGAAIDRWGAGALWLSAALGAAALGALLLMPKVSPR